MTEARFHAAADPFAVPPEHVEAYNELCHQFTLGVLELYRDALKTLIMQELPPTLQINSVSVGAMVGGIVPLMLRTGPQYDDQITAALQASMPLVIKRARELADSIIKKGHH